MGKSLMDTMLTKLTLYTSILVNKSCPRGTKRGDTGGYRGIPGEKGIAHLVGEIQTIGEFPTLGGGNPKMTSCPYYGIVRPPLGIRELTTVSSGPPPGRGTGTFHIGCVSRGCVTK
jgi:hypothetical protein